MRTFRILYIYIKAIITIPFRVLFAMFSEDKEDERSKRINRKRIEEKKTVSVSRRAKPDSFVKGEIFEDFVRDNLFIKADYDLVHRTHNYEQNSNDYIESSLLPDFKFRCKKTRIQFYIEAKFRSKYYNDFIDFASVEQFDRYQIYDNDAPVFIILALGGSSSNPNRLFLIPVSKLNSNIIHIDDLENFEVSFENIAIVKYLQES